MAGMIFRASVATLALAALAGCAAQIPSAEVTRFHLGQPIATGEVAIEPRDRAQGSGLEFDSYAAAVARELKGRGFSIATSLPRSEFIALIEVDRMSRETGPARSPFSIGIGGGSFGGGLGVGGGVSFPVGKSVAPEATRTQLFVQLKRRSDGTVIWEGRGQLDARSGTPYAAPAAAVDKIAAAMFKDFPGESGRTIIVK